MATLFRENGIEWERVDYFVEPLTAEKLRDLLRKAGLSAYDVLRKNEAKFKELALNPEMPEEKIIKHVVDNPSLLQRPIVEVGNRAVLARPVEKVFEILP